MNLYNKLNNYFSSINFHLLYKALSGVLNYRFNPFPTEEMARLNLSKMPKDIALQLSFWSLGDVLGLEVANELIGCDIVTDLINYDLAVIEKDGIRLNNLVVVSFDGYVVFVDRPTCYYHNDRSKLVLNTYIGPDSYWLLDAINRGQNGSLLELCSGSSAVSIAISNQFENVTCVELNSVAAKIANLNIKVNQKENKIKIIESDLYKNLDVTKKYDCIIANPPFIPVPRSFKEYPMCGSGGLIGTDILNKIILGAPNFLKAGGRLIIFAECLATDRDLVVDNELNRLIRLGYDVNVYVFSAVNFISHISDFIRFCEKELELKINDEELSEYLSSILNKEISFYCGCVFVAQHRNDTNIGEYNRFVFDQPVKINEHYKINFDPIRDISRISDDLYLVRNEGNCKAAYIDGECYDWIKQNIHDDLTLVFDAGLGDVNILEKCEKFKSLEATIKILQNQKLIEKKEILK